jgi:5'-3' exonuclease
MFAGHADERFRQSGHDYFVIFLRFISSYINKFRPNSVHIFWDAPSATLWRKQVFPAYKDQRADMYKERVGLDVKSELVRQMKVSIKVLQNLNVRQYFRDGQEADDLIYAFAYNNPRDEQLVISSDGDFKQLLYRFNHVKLFNPFTRDLVEKPERDPVLVKAFTGDASDNIPGYYQIGKARVKPLIDDLRARHEFLNSEKALVSENGHQSHVGNTLFERNRQLIDLSLSPQLNDNINYIEKKQVSSVNYNLDKIGIMSQEYKLRGLMADTGNLLLPFKNLQ